MRVSVTTVHYYREQRPPSRSYSSIGDLGLLIHRRLSSTHPSAPYAYSMPSGGDLGLNTGDLASSTDTDTGTGIGGVCASTVTVEEVLSAGLRSWCMSFAAYLHFPCNMNLQLMPRGQLCPNGQLSFLHVPSR